MDTARYVIATLVWIALPPAVVYWFMLHPFIAFWRRRGKTLTFSLLTIVFVGMMVALYLTRDIVLAREFGTHWTLWVAAAASYGFSINLEVRCRKFLKFRTLAGVPEVDADQAGRQILDQGIYARVRHPRYVAVTFGTLAMTLFANYLALWVLFPLIIVSLYVVAVLEEKELVASMGSTYEEYRARVPMFVPERR